MIESDVTVEGEPVMCADEISNLAELLPISDDRRGGRRNAEETPSRTGGFPFRPRDTTTRPTCATGARLWLRVVNSPLPLVRPESGVE